MTDATSCYPSARTRPADLLKLADEYRRTAGAAMSLGRKGRPISRAPYRMTAIHAVELYLSALLLHVGLSAEEVRKLNHDLAARTDLALGQGLSLREKTIQHLKTLSVSKEYLVSRYDPDLGPNLSPLNRLEATLNEVAERVGEAIGKSPGRGGQLDVDKPRLEPAAGRRAGVLVAQQARVAEPHVLDPAHQAHLLAQGMGLAGAVLPGGL